MHKTIFFLGGIMNQMFKGLVFVFSILIFPGICFAQEEYDDRTYLSSVYGILEVSEPFAESAVKTSEDTNFLGFVEQSNSFGGEQKPVLEELMVVAGGKDMDVIEAMKPKRSSFMMNTDLDRTNSKALLAYYNKIIELSTQAQASSTNEAVKAYAAQVIELATPIQLGFKDIVDNWEPEFEGGFG